MKINIQTDNILNTVSDLLVVGCFKDNIEEGLLSNIDSKLEGFLKDIIKQEEFTGEYKEKIIIHTFNKIPAKKILVLGLGKIEKFNEKIIRESAGILVKTANEIKAKKITTSLLQDFNNVYSGQCETHCFVEGLFLANYRFDGYHYKEQKRNNIEEVQIFTLKNEVEAVKGLKSGLAYATGTNLARDLMNIPSNLLYPKDIAQKALEIAEEYEMDCKILDKNEIEKEKMGGLLSVGQGSIHDPRMIVLKYQGREEWDNILGLVGKGITFDSGGISLKPSQNMHEMKGDMGGAAVVLGVMEALGQLKPNTNVLAVIPSAENMPSGSAYKPGDVITTMSGKTVEILNTDAEGRVVLADGITYAKELGADYLIDIATLTGAVVTSLGSITTGAMTNEQIFLENFLKNAKIAGEKVWQLPMFEEYNELIKSDIADVKNSGGRQAGAIVAAKFLETFAEKTPWIHLDIAGTSWLNKETLLEKKGGTGAMVRSLVEYIQNSK